MDGAGTYIPVLNSIELDVDAGDSVAIIGPSGSGKSTLLSLLAGLDVPNSGFIEFNNAPFSVLSEDQRSQIRKGQIGFVFQSFQLLQGLTALENVMLPLELAGTSVLEAEARANTWLDRVGLSERANHHLSLIHI